jgi:two-component system response regulator FixJ
MSGVVYVVDDDAGMREALSSLLETAGFDARFFADGAAFLAACDAEAAGCVILDLAMPGMSGEQVQAEMIARGVTMPIIFLTGTATVASAVRTVQAGALDFLEKPVRGPELLECIRQALAHDESNREQQAWQLEVVRAYGRVTPREREVMALVVAGMPNKEIARTLGISHRTVEAHRGHIMQKMGTEHVAELVNMAVQCGLDLPEPS